MQVNFSPIISYKQKPVIQKNNGKMSFQADTVTFQARKSLPPPSVNPARISLGCTYNKERDSLDFGLFSENAGHVELWVYKQPHGKDAKYKPILIESLKKDESTSKWTTSINTATLKKKGIDINNDDAIFYGYRVWGKPGSNWEYKEGWKPGSDEGFRCHKDDNGNCFNPNKLLTDPESTEISHDPVTPGVTPHADNFDKAKEQYATGEGTYKIDTAPFAPKTVFVMPKNNRKALTEAQKEKLGLNRPVTSDSVYEVHVNDLTASATPESLTELYEKRKEDNPEMTKQINDMQRKIKREWKPEYAGTYKGAAFMALYLKLLGFTMVEFLPVQEYQNSEDDHFWKNHWGYMTHSYKAPDRQLASDRSWGGPTKEFKEMVDAFHEQGEKVCIDVVYNHTGEGGCYENPASKNNPDYEDRVLVDKTELLNLRGIDNKAYYRTDGYTGTPLTKPGENKTKRYKNKTYHDNINGCGADFNTQSRLGRTLILDSLKYFVNEMGVDGLRFDLAPAVGNTHSDKHGYAFRYASEKDNVESMDTSTLKAIEDELPARPRTGGSGVDLIAEPWAALGDQTQEQGNFSGNYSEWNDKARDTIRKVINGKGEIIPGNLTNIIAGSQDPFGKKSQNIKADMNRPRYQRSVNFVTCHDGFTMHDLFAYNNPRTGELGSEGGTGGADNHSWDQGGNGQGNINQRKQAVRTAQTLIALSAGTPMIAGGDERYRTFLGNNNPWNINGALNHIEWGKKGNKEHQQEVDSLRKAGKLKFENYRDPNNCCKWRYDDTTYKMTEPEKDELTKFTSRLFKFRQSHPALRAIKYMDGTDHNNNGLRDVTWLNGEGNTMDGDYFNNPYRLITAFRIDGTEFRKGNYHENHFQEEKAESIYVAYNKGENYNAEDRSCTVKLPKNQKGKQWFMVADTSVEPNNILGGDNIKKEGDEIPMTSDELKVRPRSLVIFIEKDKQEKNKLN